MTFGVVYFLLVQQSITNREIEIETMGNTPAKHTQFYDWSRLISKSIFAIEVNWIEMKQNEMKWSSWF